MRSSSDKASAAFTRELQYSASTNWTLQYRHITYNKFFKYLIQELSRFQIGFYPTGLTINFKKSCNGFLKYTKNHSVHTNCAQVGKSSPVIGKRLNDRGRYLGSFQRFHQTTLHTDSVRNKDVRVMPLQL